MGRGQDVTGRRRSWLASARQMLVFDRVASRP
jgi:hypothetical protein